MMIFTVPVYDRDATIERAHRVGGAIDCQCEPLYRHGPLRCHHGPRHCETIFAFRDYRRDIADRRAAAGFVDASIVTQHVPLAGTTQVVVARERKDSTQ